jgi:hypothetical protein
MTLTSHEAVAAHPLLRRPPLGRALQHPLSTASVDVRLRPLAGEFFGGKARQELQLGERLAVA